MKRSAIVLGVCLGALGCGDDDGAVGVDAQVVPMDAGLVDGGMSDAARLDAAVTPCDAVGVSCTAEGLRRECVSEGGVLVAREQSCEGGTACLLGECATQVQQQTADQLRRYIAEVRSRSGHPFEEDYEALEEEALRTMLAEPDPERALVRGATRFARSYGHGHQSLTFGNDGAACGGTDGYAYMAQTFFAGVCGAPSGDSVLVMSAPEGNVLGLVPGDTIVDVDAWEGDGLLDRIAAAPGCPTRMGASVASDRAEAAASFFGKIEEGMVLTVRNPIGRMRSVTVPARQADIEAGQDFCLNPFGGYGFVEAELTMRPDGVAVIRNSTLRPERWTDTESYLREVQNMLERIAAVIASVPDGAPIIWDIRGNSGGSAEVALGIVAGMPGAISTEVSQGHMRVVDSEPPAWRDEPEALQSYSMTVSDELVTNHRDHRVAVLVNGQSLSAADFFAYAAKEFTDALVVGPEGTSGSYGFGGLRPRNIDGPVIALQHRVDPLRVRTPAGEFLERRSVEPDMVVAYAPADVAAGVDTVLEAAAAALLER